MVKQILAQLAKHKAGIAIGMAAVGVPICCYIAVKEADLYYGDLAEAKEKKFDEVAPEEVKEKIEEYEEAPFLKKRIWVDKNNALTKKERAWIFAKNHWRTGIAILSTELLMIFSFKSISKELAGATAALAVAISKHEEIEDYFRKNYPKEYKQFKETINKEKIEKIFNERPELAGKPEDDRDLYYDPWSCQVFRATKAEILEAECFINEQMSNTGVATLFDYLATFPTSSGVKLDTWMQHFGWYEGDTVYSYSAGYYGSYLKPTIRVQNIIFKGEKLEVNAIEWVHDMDLEPELTTGEIVGIEHALEEAYENIA